MSPRRFSRPIRSAPFGCGFTRVPAELPEHKARYTFRLDETALDGRTELPQLPSWLTPEDLDYYANDLASTAFREALNWYRAQDIFWEATPFLIGRQLLQPTLFIDGADDPWIAQVSRPGVDNLEKSVPNLCKKVLLPGVGHWIEQEAPTDVNRLFIEFLRQVDSMTSTKAGK